MPDQVPSHAPHEAALRDWWFGGRKDAEIRLASSLGEDDAIPVAVFFREPEEFFPFETYALELCHGRVLDAGAGTGVHALPLQARGFDVTAVEILASGVEILRDRGVANVVAGDVFALDLPAFDTVLLMMNGIGPVATLAGLDRFFDRMDALVAPGGQVLVDSGAARPAEGVDAAAWPPPTPDAYPGEAWIRLTYGDLAGAPFRELYLDPVTLRARAAAAGWGCTIVHEEGGGYLARLTR